MSRITSSIGPLSLSWPADSPLLPGELRSFPQGGGGGTCELRLTALRPDEPLDLADDVTFIGKGTVALSRSDLAIFSHKRFEYLLRGLFTEASSVELRFRSKRVGPRVAAEILAYDWFIPNGYQRSDPFMSYSLFWWVTTALLTKVQAAFIHAASLSVNDTAVLLAGTGGCGKTSCVLAAMQQPEWRYLGEDFSVLDATGTAHFSPKSISLYPSDISSLKAPDRGLRNASMIAGALHRTTKPKLKVAPATLFGSDRLGSSAKIGHALFMVRSDRTVAEAETISPEEFAERASYASMREMTTMVELLNMAAANSSAGMPYPTPEEFRQRLVSIYTEAVKQGSCHLLRVPRRFTPDDVFSQVRACCDL